MEHLPLEAGNFFIPSLEMKGESAKLIIFPRWHSQWVVELVLNPSVFSKLGFCATVILSPLNASSFSLSLSLSGLNLVLTRILS